MRLLNIETLAFEEFNYGEAPEYAILSHTWEADEVLYHDILNSTPDRPPRKKGFRKIQRSCQRAREDDFEWIWIDTCCIDKTNSTELSMSINSMFEWYAKSSVCYALVSDCKASQFPFIVDTQRPSRWFTRGWTLQELLAPNFVVFVDRHWVDIGTRSGLASQISRCTGIKTEHLNDFQDCNIATKMSWAANRNTSVMEDEAYCLLGLFDVHMPLIYEEGRNAFTRLQKELITRHDDESVFAWNAYTSEGRLFAKSPADFKPCIPMYLDTERIEFFMTSKGLVFHPLLYRARERQNQYLAPLNCGTEDADGQSCFALLLETTGNNTYRRVSNSTKIGFPQPNVGGLGELIFLGRKRICIQHDTSLEWPVLERREYWVRFRYPPAVRKRCIKSIKMNVPHDLDRALGRPQGASGQSISTRDDVVMRLGMFAVAEMEITVGGRDVKFGIAISRCGDSVTLQGWLCRTTAEFDAWVERTRPVSPQLPERQDTIELEPIPGSTIEIQLRPKRGRIVEDPNGERQRLETMLVTIALRDTRTLPIR